MTQRWSITAAIAAALALLVTSALAVSATEPGTDSDSAAAPSDVGIDIRPMLDDRTAPGDVLQQRQATAFDHVGRRGFRPHVTGRTAQGANELLVEDFEVSVLDPLKWLLIYDVNGQDFGEYFWTLEQCHASTRTKYGGIQSLWALGGGRDGETLACEDPYPRGARASALLTLDLSGFAEDVRQLDLVFDFFLNTRTFQEEGIVPDGLFLILYPDASSLETPVVIDGVTASKPEGFFLNALEYDLTNVCNDYDPEECFNLAGKSVILEFFFISQMRNGTRLPGGTFVDNIRLLSDSTPLMHSTPVEQPAVRGLDLIRLTDG